MSSTPQLFRIHPNEKRSDIVQEVEFSTLGLQERYDIQEWVAANPGILGDDLLIIAKEFSDFDKTKERLDLLAVDRSGKLVIIELKRDDSGADTHWQAIKYASYLDRTPASEVVRMLAAHEAFSEEEATTKLQGHLDAGDLSTLNNGQRIILVSHRFAPEVTSAVLWLNEQTGTDLMTCVQLTPYQDGETASLYLLANTIIPVPGVEAYQIQVGSGGSFGLTPAPSRASNPYTDQINRAIGETINLAEETLPDELVTDHSHKQGRWGYWKFWYSREPWKEWELMYRLILHKKEIAPTGLMPEEAFDTVQGEWAAAIQLYATRSLPQIVEDGIAKLSVEENCFLSTEDRMVLLGTAEITDTFVNKFAIAVRQFIQTLTPLIDEAYEQGQFKGDDADEENAEKEN